MSLKTFERISLADTRAYVVGLIDGLCEQFNTTEWTNRDDDDLGILFADIAAVSGDLLNFYIDNQAREVYLPSAVQRKNVKRILSLVDYKLRGPEPARTTLEFETSTPRSFDVTIPRYFQVAHADRNGEGDVYYATWEDAAIMAGDLRTQVEAVQGRVHTVDLTVADLARFRTTTIMDEDVANGSVIIEVDGTEWEQVPDVLYETDQSRKYSVYENLEDHTVIEFGYSWRDDLPSDPSIPVKIRYLTTDGATGGLSTGRVDTVADRLTVNNQSVSGSLTVTNVYDATGGADRESVETAREMAPRVVRARDLMATLVDYRTFAENVPGVLRASAVDWNIRQGEFVPAPYRVDVRIVPEDRYAYVPCQTQLDHVARVLEPHRWSAIDLHILPPEIYSVDIIVRATTREPESAWPVIRREIESLYAEHFDKTNMDFAEEITVGSLENVARLCGSIDSAEILAPGRSLFLTEIEFPKLGRVDVELVQG